MPRLSLAALYACAPLVNSPQCNLRNCLLPFYYFADVPTEDAAVRVRFAFGDFARINRSSNFFKSVKKET